MLRDLRYAARLFLRAPAFTLVAVVSLALGVGANTAIFSFVNAILLKHLPVPEPSRLTAFAQIYRGREAGIVWPLSLLDNVAHRDPAFRGVFGWYSKAVSLSTGDTARWVRGELVTGEYFETLQVQPAIGRLLNEDDVRNAAANPVCVVSYDLWQRQFAGDPAAIGRTLFLNNHAYRILGVTARGFYGAELQARFDVAIPATRLGDFMPDFAGSDRQNSISWLTPLARLKPGVTRDEARQQTQLLLRQIDPFTKTDLRLEDGSQGLNTMRSTFGQPVVVLMGVVALVMLATCINLANLLLARAQARAREFAVRLSVGASRGGLIRQLLLESLLLAAAGGAGGIALSFWIENTLLAFLNTGRSAESALHVSPDARVLAFSVLLTFLTAILFGLVPAWQATRPDLAPGLKQDGSAGSRLRLRRSLVALQIAVSLVIVFTAGLLTRTLRTLATVDLGFESDRVLALNVDPAASGHSSADAANIFDEILARARDLGGVKAASLSVSPPGAAMAISMPVDVPGYDLKPVRGDNVVDFNFISPGYFETLGQPLLRGRDFNQRDSKNARRVAIVNEKFVHHYLNGRDPIGEKFRQGGGEVEIVGVTADARDHGVRNGVKETVYLPEKQGMVSGLTLLVRSQNDPRQLIPSLLAIVQSIDRRMPVFSIHTLDQDVAAGLSSERILGYLSTLFAALATMLAAVGLYGVLAYSVTRRTREIGIRFAVGAQRREVAALFARESLALLLIGLLLGAPAALLAARALKAVLFGVAATDPLTLLISTVVLAAAAILATSIPLWRASRIDPMAALRDE